jgi:uncharacterized protein YeaO (DUF488 family)
MEPKAGQPTFIRQRFLLSFLRQLKESVSATDLQKLIFLNVIREGSNYYEFVPYKFGSYSFRLAEDLDILHRDGFISRHIDQGSTKYRAVGDHPVEKRHQICSKRGNELIRLAYREYPYYAMKSEIIDRLFSGEELKQIRQIQHSYTHNEQVLFTIGYEGKSLEAFLNTLIQTDVRLLCDVRRNPLSRKFGFSKKKLQGITNTLGIKYRHIPDLGIAANLRGSLNSEPDYKRLFHDYAVSLADKQSSLDEVLELMEQHTRIALMCYELDPRMCHRHVVSDYLARRHQIKSEDL